MRIAVTGASGNVGVRLLERLRAEAAVSEIVGIARRPPTEPGERTTWVALDLGADSAETPLPAALAGVDAVVHLAWLIQPSHAPRVMERVNVGGTSRVLRAVATAGVPALVHASSVGAYSPAAKTPRHDESYPTGGIPGSLYSAQKAAAERLVDAFERDHPGVRVARVRPAIVLQRDAGAEQSRYFLGRLVPASLLRRPLLPVAPLPDRLVTQVVHAADIADLFARAALSDDARGAYNGATEPVLDPDAIAAVLSARRVRVPEALLRAVVEVTWRLRLQPTDGAGSNWGCVPRSWTRPGPERNSAGRPTPTPARHCSRLSTGSPPVPAAGPPLSDGGYDRLIGLARCYGGHYRLVQNSPFGRDAGGGEVRSVSSMGTRIRVAAVPLGAALAGLSLPAAPALAVTCDSTGVGTGSGAGAVPVGVLGTSASRLPFTGTDLILPLLLLAAVLVVIGVALRTAGRRHRGRSTAIAVLVATVVAAGIGVTAARPALAGNSAPTVSGPCLGNGGTTGTLTGSPTGTSPGSGTSTAPGGSSGTGATSGTQPGSTSGSGGSTGSGGSSGGGSNGGGGSSGGGSNGGGGSAPGQTVPEVPLAAVLPLAGLALLGGTLVARRRGALR